MPLPNDWLPRRQMISKNSVGRSCSGLVKICRRYPSFIAIGQQSQVADALGLFLDLADPLPHGVVVGVGNRQEINAAAAQLIDRADRVGRQQRQVLDARGLGVPIQIFLDLALPSPFGGFVDGDLDQVAPRIHDLGHQRGVLGGNVLVIEMLEQLELQHLLVPANPIVHLPHFHVPHAVVDVEEPARMLAVVDVDFKLRAALKRRRKDPCA